ncbi:MAG: ATP-dependent DNA helicase RecG [Sutterellaceae bacterium]|nr:ATP-dependent DNA helicase RecG [Sutterellaceae bacterium]
MPVANTSSPYSGALRKKGEKLPPLKDRLARLGLVNDWDYVLHLPLRYEDRTQVTPISALVPESYAQIQGTVTHTETKFGKFHQLIVHVEDDTATIELRFLHFYPSQKKMMAEGNLIRAYGQVKRNPVNGFYQMVHPKVQAGENAVADLPSSLTPVYPAGEGIQQRWLTARIDRALLDVDIIDLVPATFLKARDLPPLAQAIRDLHHPPKGADTKSYMERTCPAWERLKLDELLAQQVTLIGARNNRKKNAAYALTGKADGFYDRFVAALPFKLTGAQVRALNEVKADLRQTNPMHRLVQGDVGCGKTIVAALSALVAIDSGFQAALMAPTEILAEQHYEKLTHWLEPLGVRMLWLSGSLKAKEKAAAQEKIAAGDVDLVVGTHALIQEAVNFAKLGLAIVDEQHRFGVAQRLKLRTHAVNDCTPHLLMLSATPIPRTLAMSYLADIDISVIDELPAGRSPIATKLISLSRIDEVIHSIGVAVRQDKRQCYWVCPLIEESEKAELTAAKIRAQTLVEELPDCRIGLVHGAMTSEEKQSVMQRFSQGDLDVLVATTVIEVGVDVPNASVMVIEHAERFGLSQLHQLRGRVGRGSVQSLCLLLFDPDLSDTGKARLRTIKNSNDGFEIAREDLKLRGPGEFMGARQSGVPALRFADIEADALLIEEAKAYAAQWLDKDPETAAKHAQRWFSSQASFMDA